MNFAFIANMSPLLLSLFIIKDIKSWNKEKTLWKNTHKCIILYNTTCHTKLNSDLKLTIHKVEQIFLQSF